MIMPVLAKNLMLVIPEFTLGSRRVTLAKIGRPFMTEVDKLRREIKELKAKNREMEVQIAFAKKLTEIRNRGVRLPDETKQFRK